MGTIADHVIAKCGGHRAVAGLLGLDVTSVYKWTYPSSRGGTNGLVPANRQQELLHKSREAGIDLIPADFFEPRTSISADTRDAAGDAA
ncbi:hypothetical protein CR492_04805 [Methylocella silvestris]|uniref:Uncharacterized protein n=1 Tax=Methylocella silvestris TaxID=199596 RepID=A0A2J7TJX4_METSI|nr:hypothetical protein CR492_04805 [Methylocella silvestris]